MSHFAHAHLTHVHPLTMSHFAHAHCTRCPPIEHVAFPLCSSHDHVSPFQACHISLEHIQEHVAFCTCPSYEHVNPLQMMHFAHAHCMGMSRPPIEAACRISVVSISQLCYSIKHVAFRSCPHRTRMSRFAHAHRMGMSAH